MIIRSRSTRPETDTYPQPRIEEILTSLGGGTVFSKLDLAHAYQQIVIEDEAKEMVTINIHKGLYRVNRLSFRVASAPSMFQRVMESILQGVPGVIVYIDDILVSEKTVDEHLQNLDTTLTKLEEAGLLLKRLKCSFLLPSVEYLGYKISKKGLQPIEDKVKAIHKAPAPTDVSQLKSFLGLVNYYVKFLPDLSTVLMPLYKLLWKDTQWSWGEAQQKVFENVNFLLTSEHLLVHYNPDQELVPACDVSPYGVGVVLLHHRAVGKEQSVEFASCTLAPAENIYS